MISLPTAIQTIVTRGGVSVETNAAASVTEISIDFVNKQVTCFLKQGSVSGQNFSAGQFPPVLHFTINYSTGVWTTSTGLTGQATSAQLASIRANFLGLRNIAEAFTVNISGMLPGSAQTVWTTA
jgi:hypothetical protein